MAFSVTGAVTVSNATPKVGQKTTVTYTITDGGADADVHILRAHGFPLASAATTTCTIGEARPNPSDYKSGAGTVAKTSGTLTLSSTIATDTITLNGVTMTIVASGAVGSQINLGASDALTAVNIAEKLRSLFPWLRTSSTGSVVTAESDTGRNWTWSATGATITASAISAESLTTGLAIAKSGGTGVVLFDVVLHAPGAVSISAAADGTRDDTGAAFSVVAAAGVTITAS